MDRLRSLTTFVRVVELGSLAAAARDLGMSPAMAGNHIRSLEAWFAAPLLLRTTRQQRLTDAGHEVLAEARNVLAGMTALERTAERTGDLSGPIRLSASVAVGRHYVAPALRELLRRHPRLSVELRLSDYPEDLVRSALDLAVRNGPLSGGEASLVARMIARQPLQLAASPGYLAAAGTPKTLAEIERRSTVRYCRDGRPRAWPFPTEGGLIHLDPPTSFIADDVESLCDAARDGLGIALLPGPLLDPYFADGSLVRVLPDQPPSMIDIYLVRPNALYPSQKVLEVADFLADAIPRAMRLKPLGVANTAAANTRPAPPQVTKLV